MKSSKRKYVRIVIRHPKLVRAGTNLLLLGLLIAAVFSAEPSDTDFGMATIQPIKYASLIAASLSVACYVAGIKGLPVRWLPVLLGGLSVLCVGGGILTRVRLDYPLFQTFTGRGVCVLTFAPAYILGLLPKERHYFGKWAGRIIVAVALVMCAVLAEWRMGFRFVARHHIYHEEVIYFCAAAGIMAANAHVALRRSAVLFFALASAATFKLTGFGLATIVVLVLWVVETAKRRGEGGRRLVNRRVWITQFVLSLSGIAVMLAAVYRDYLPGGTRAVRLATYGERLSEFGQSPIWGSFFYGSPVMQEGWMIIPSHSDLLDLLAFGGLVGATLFAVPVGVAIVHGCRNAGRFLAERDRFALFGLTVVMCFLFESAFNPVLAQPKLCFLFWMGLGVLLADYTVGRALGQAVPVRGPRIPAAPVKWPSPPLAPAMADRSGTR